MHENALTDGSNDRSHCKDAAVEDIASITVMQITDVITILALFWVCSYLLLDGQCFYQLVTFS